MATTLPGLTVTPEPSMSPTSGTGLGGGGGYSPWTTPMVPLPGLANFSFALSPNFVSDMKANIIEQGLLHGYIKLTEIDPSTSATPQLLSPEDWKGITLAAGSGVVGTGATVWMAAVNGAEAGVEFGPVGMGVGGFIGAMAGLVVTNEAWNCFQVSYQNGGCAFTPVIAAGGQ